MSHLPLFKAAAVHASPVFLDKEASTEKAISLMREAAKNGAELIVFPESYIPAFPIWSALWAPIYNHDLSEAMIMNSLLVPGDEVNRIRTEAKTLGVFVSLGFSERNRLSAGLGWNANIFISDHGELLIHHRKLVPTYFEKMAWANGDGGGLRVANTRIGNIGALICGENTNPLARYALMAQGEQVHISTWPAVWPTRKPSVGGNYDNVTANRLRAGAHCFEAKVWGIVCAGFMDRRMRDFIVNRDSAAAEIVDNTPRAVTMFLDPTGAQVGEMLQNEEGILYQDIDLSRCVEPKQFHDLVGYYNRFDVFNLSVTRTRQTPISFVSGVELATGDVVVDGETWLSEDAPVAAPVR